MNKRKTFLIFFLLMSISSIGYSKNKEKEVISKVNKIHSHWKKVFGNRFLNEHLAGILPTDKNFRFLCEKPTYFEPQLLKILSEKNISLEKKYIALYALQYQCEEKYSPILNKIYGFFSKGMVNEQFLISSIRQDGFSLEVISNSNKSDSLKQLLQRISTDSKVSIKNRNWIKEVLTTDYYTTLKDDLNQVGEEPFECK